MAPTAAYPEVNAAGKEVQLPMELLEPTKMPSLVTASSQMIFRFQTSLAGEMGKEKKTADVVFFEDQGGFGVCSGGLPVRS